MLDDEIPQELVAIFAEEATELCEQCTRAVVELERVEGNEESRRAQYDLLARGLHTLKGSAATVGLADLASVAHKMEELVLPRRHAASPIPREIADRLLPSLDRFSAIARRRADRPGELSPATELLQGLEPAAGETVDAPPLSEGRTPNKPGDAQPRVGLEAVDDESVWHVEAHQVLRLMREMERLDGLQRALQERRAEVYSIVEALSRTAHNGDSGDVAAMLARLADAVSVDAERASELAEIVEDRLRAIGTQPVRTVLDPLHRAVRDLCRTTGKEARLSVVGAEASLERHVLAGLKACLLHLVRNAIDHGIELPQERERLGKHREGALVVRVEQHGNSVFVEVADDGRGLDLERIRQVALERGAVLPDEAATMDPQQIRSLIFLPSFSTSRALTETSGRGVGLDVVKEKVEALRGHVEVQSVVNNGTRFTMTLPVELGSSPVLLVRFADHQMGVPLAAVEAVVAANRENVRPDDGAAKMSLVWEDRVIPLRDLSAIMKLREPRAPREGQPVVVLHSHGTWCSLAVDEIVGDRDLVVRPLPRALRDVAAYQGALTTPNGELVLLLRPEWLVDGQGEADAAIRGGGRVLVIDDSITARTMHRSILESGGYTVHAVSGPEQALDQLESARYDAIVCDVSMTPLDGISFTAALRRRGDTRRTPIILVSEHDGEGFRERALTGGADLFLSKAHCAGGRLLAEVSRILAARAEGAE